ncbi:MAG: hypothetical protein COU09_01670 [Candidatus Harrisonbacteria bacterium CG10_big_fil_rev_8_21_14_0_10_44_23]|uniref:SHS2 domain-containing protein n=1 Tax=Candidatus Harrisonbacteria bacterium CG10_big_fil_rev_8_21_14_0_10_44_23 TaxID=1974585 RepID=A0A2H0UQ22_9BACT|nr:MAG: hypothetical protein COU09_01670 [Candidatus Harrisonbacteria bacterium CG10_big_fil_rev_8_21_14_0_10_44_23]
MKLLFASKIMSLLSPDPKIGGLEISHDSVRYVSVRNLKSVTQASVKLAPKTIVNGEIKERRKLFEALVKLQKRVSPKGKTVHVNLILSSFLVFTQAFNTPDLEGEDLKEAIDLNLQGLSPQDIENNYYDWQEIGKATDGTNLELLGAFANNKIVDQYTSILFQAGFDVSSIEFPGAAIARLLKDRWSQDSKKANYLVVYTNSEGVLLLIIKNDALYFNHFNAWKDLLKNPEEKIEFEHIQQFFKQDLQKVLNFYHGKTKHRIEKAVILSPFFEYDISQLLEKEFRVEAVELSIPDLPVTPPWFPVLGACLRGLIPRSKDVYISLGKSNIQQGYYHSKSLSFIKMWRKISVTTLLFMILSFAGLDFLLLQTQLNQGLDELGGATLTYQEEYNNYQTRAEEFNSLIATIEKVEKEETPFSPVIENVRTHAAGLATINRIFFDKQNSVILINANSNSEITALEFKKSLEEDPYFTNINLPLSNIKSQPDGTVSLSLTLNIRAQLKEIPTPETR